MANSLIENVNGAYYRNLSRLTGRGNMVNVIVEDELDVAFWNDILTYVLPLRKFRITPYTYDTNGTALTKGKAHILNLASGQRLNELYWGCVDSDYDYLLSETSDDGQIIKDNRYLLQTYAYSIENLLCCMETLENVCVKANKEQPIFDIVEYMNAVSNILYPLLIWSLYLSSKEYGDFTVSQWADIFPYDKNINASNSEATKILNTIKNRRDSLIDKLSTIYSNELEEKDLFESHLKEQYNITPTNCYFYVRGHDIYRFVLKVILEGILYESRARHRREINDNVTTEEEKKNLQNHYNHLLADIESILNTNYDYKLHSSAIFNKIKNDIMAIA